jgi:hypothetical protein
MYPITEALNANKHVLKGVKDDSHNHQHHHHSKMLTGAIVPANF